MHDAGWLFKVTGLWFASILTITSSVPTLALAQSSTDEPWAAPLNLSQSGSAIDPAVFIDSDSAMHVVWQDVFANYVETRFSGGQWTVPQITGLHVLFGQLGSQPSSNGTGTEPFTGPNPLFVAGDGSTIFAFWITPEGKLYTRRVFNSQFANAAAWTGRILLSDSAASFAAAVDAGGDLHLAFVRTAAIRGRPAGIYHTSLKRLSQTWSAPALLYESGYFRGLAGGKANLSLATAGTADAPLVYVVWDNRPRKQVLLVKSADGGESWEQPVQVAGPTPNSGLNLPYNIRVGATENKAILVWQNGQPGGVCTQFFQSSGDAGASWSEPQLMDQGLPGCPKSNEFVVGRPASPGGLLYLLTNTKSEVFLSAWNGSQWSQMQVQPVLSGFEDPELYMQVVYDCHRAVWFEERLTVVGCDRGGGGDIWITSRDVKSATSWFVPPIWSQAAPVGGENLAVSNVAMVATADNLIHVFFSKRQDPAIYYTRWDGTTWSRTTAVLKVPDGEADWPAVAAGPGDELFLIARSSAGSLFFSRARSADAVTLSAWALPTRIPLTYDGSVSPAHIEWDASGTVSVAYSVPVNSERGVYLVQSKDVGKNWSEPSHVFDGAAAKFELVGAPSLLTAADGTIHVIWKKQSVRVDGFSQPLALYYARSEDAGSTFSKAEVVIEAPVTWRDIVADGKGNIHRLWQQPDNKSNLWDQVSLDGGRTWQSTQRLSSEEGIATVTLDKAGQIHLLNAGTGSLGEWLWDKTRWQAEPSHNWSLPALREAPAALLASAVNSDGKMVVVVGVPTEAADGAQTLLYYATRTLELPAGSNASHRISKRHLLVPTAQ